jgi:hypothetical protein
MAFTKTITLKNNFGTESSFENAYIKIVKLTGTKDRMCADVAAFTAKDGGPLKTQKVYFAPDLSASNFIKQAYEQTKLLPEFSDAKDC